MAATVSLIGPVSAEKRAGTHHALPVALDGVGEQLLLLWPGVRGADEAYTSQPLGGERGKLAALIGARAGVAADAARERAQAKHERRHDDEAQQRQPERDAGEDEQRGTEQKEIPDQRDHRGGDDALCLIGLVDQRRHQQAGASAVEEAEVEPQEMIVELASQARDEALLHAGIELRRRGTRPGS